MPQYFIKKNDDPSLAWANGRINETQSDQRKKTGAVVLGGSYIGLGATRSLASHGVPVTLVDDDISLAYFSRSVSRRIHSPALENEELCLAFLERVAVEFNLSGSVLIPSTNDSVKLLAKHEQVLSENYRITVSDWAITEYLYDKRLTRHLARRQGVPIPETYNPTDLEELAAIDFRFPVILKPAVSTRFKQLTNEKAYRVDNRADLIAKYQKMSSIVDPGDILVQDLIPGGADRLYSFFGFFKQGKLVAGYAAKRPRQKPMDFGMSSTLVVTVDIPELERLSLQLLSELGYSGLAEVEFMYDAIDDRFELIEVNPRLWGWHTLSIAAGVDLPYLVYADAIGEPVDPGCFHEGVKWIHMVTDLQVAPLEIWHGRLGISSYLHSLWGSQDAVISWRDPLPMVAEVLIGLFLIIKRLF